MLLKQLKIKQSNNVEFHTTLLSALGASLLRNVLGETGLIPVEEGTTAAN